MQCKDYAKYMGMLQKNQVCSVLTRVFEPGDSIPWGRLALNCVKESHTN
jgi:hypothetical protein